MLVRDPAPFGHDGSIPTGADSAGVPARGTGIGSLTVASRHGQDLPCRSDDADLWFAEAPAELERAKALCGDCPIQAECLAGALRRAEPWGVWGGEIFERGAVVPRKRPRGRPGRPTWPVTGPTSKQSPPDPSRRSPEDHLPQGVSVDHFTTRHAADADPTGPDRRNRDVAPRSPGQIPNAGGRTGRARLRTGSRPHRRTAVADARPVRKSTGRGEGRRCRQPRSRLTVAVRRGIPAAPHHGGRPTTIGSAPVICSDPGSLLERAAPRRRRPGSPGRGAVACPSEDRRESRTTRLGACSCAFRDDLVGVSSAWPPRPRRRSTAASADDAAQRDVGVELAEHPEGAHRHPVDEQVLRAAGSAPARCGSRG